MLFWGFEVESVNIIKNLIKIVNFDYLPFYLEEYRLNSS